MPPTAPGPGSESCAVSYWWCGLGKPLDISVPGKVVLMMSPRSCLLGTTLGVWREKLCGATFTREETDTPAPPRKCCRQCFQAAGEQDVMMAVCRRATVLSVTGWGRGEARRTAGEEGVCPPYPQVPAESDSGPPRCPKRSSLQGQQVGMAALPALSSSWPPRQVPGCRLPDEASRPCLHGRSPRRGRCLSFIYCMWLL